MTRSPAHTYPPHSSGYVDVFKAATSPQRSTSSTTKHESSETCRYDKHSRSVRDRVVSGDRCSKKDVTQESESGAKGNHGRNSMYKSVAGTCDEEHKPQSRTLDFVLGAARQQDAHGFVKDWNKSWKVLKSPHKPGEQAQTAARDRNGKSEVPELLRCCGGWNLN